MKFEINNDGKRIHIEGRNTAVLIENNRISGTYVIEDTPIITWALHNAVTIKYHAVIEIESEIYYDISISYNDREYHIGKHCEYELGIEEEGQFMETTTNMEKFVKNWLEESVPSTFYCLHKAVETLLEEEA